LIFVLYYIFQFSGESFARKGTLRQRIVRKLSKRYKSRESLDDAAESNPVSFRLK